MAMRANVNIKASSTCKGPADSAKKEKKKKKKSSKNMFAL